MPKEVIIIKQVELTKLDSTEAWGSLTKCCEAHNDFQYHSIKMQNFPFIHKGYEFKKIKYNHKIKLQDGKIS